MSEKKTAITTLPATIKKALSLIKDDRLRYHALIALGVVVTSRPRMPEQFAAYENMQKLFESEVENGKLS